ncbi:MAG: hypothetical protein AB7U18_26265 [Dehalococcoidia bacterium]
MQAISQPQSTASRPRSSFVFVGERRSRRAIELGALWEHGRLCAKTLHTALRAVGLDPTEQLYLNLFTDDDPPILDEDVLARTRKLAEAGAKIVGLGRTVRRALERAGVPHRRLIHPAARGAVRARAAYQAHAAAIFGPHVDPAASDDALRHPDKGMKLARTEASLWT